MGQSGVYNYEHSDKDFEETEWVLSPYKTESLLQAEIQSPTSPSSLVSDPKDVSEPQIPPNSLALSYLQLMLPDSGQQD